MRLPLRNQVLATTLGLLLATIGVLTWLHAAASARRNDERIQQQLSGVYRALTDATFPLTPEVLEKLKLLSGAEFVVTDASGKLLARTGSLAVADTELPQLRSLKALSGPQEIRLNQTQRFSGESFFTAAVAVPPGGGIPGQKIYILFSEDLYRQTFWASVRPSLFVAAFAVALVLVIGTTLASTITRPLKQFQLQVERISRGDLCPIDVKTANDEILDLSQSINRMAEKLSENELRVRQSERLQTLVQLGSGIAHKLRNCVTGCRMAVDLHERECGLADSPPNSERGSLGVAKRQLRMMEQYVSQFLSLAGARGSEAVKPAESNCAEVLADVITLMGPMMTHRGVQCTTVGSSDYSVRLRADELQQVLINLLTNAADAAAEMTTLDASTPAHVRVELQRCGDSVVLTVCDNGTGPQISAGKDILDPFVTFKPDGVGLGLSLCREIVERAGGEIAWSRSDGETQFSITLPTNPEKK